MVARAHGVRAVQGGVRGPGAAPRCRNPGRVSGRVPGRVFVPVPVPVPGRNPAAGPLSVAYGTIARMHGSRQPDPGPPPYGAQGPPGEPELPDYAERVLQAAERIPPGRVLTYGDVAEWVEEGGPRQVGRVMALYGGAVPWWRVVRADGVLLAGHELRAVERYRAEGTPLREAGRAAEGHIPRIDMRRARWGGTD